MSASVVWIWREGTGAAASLVMVPRVRRAGPRAAAFRGVTGVRGGAPSDGNLSVTAILCRATRVDPRLLGASAQPRTAPAAPGTHSRRTGRRPE
ncbi:hypothetical protein Sgou_26870 [Streptomyces gougerotii]|uniref:Uncharacterized protein n=1 Tax=Streptomyces gougerotii TaxID=53448 RepID=A0ABQ1D634_9ACTN|nr:hypothetical protein Sgou_26870 [Streptomyces gougerotii]